MFLDPVCGCLSYDHNSSTNTQIHKHTYAPMHLYNTVTHRRTHTQIAELEMRESNARKKAARLEDSLKQMQGQVTALEDDIAALTKNLSDSKTAYQVQKDLNAQLRSQVEGRIPFAKAERLHADLQITTQRLAELRAELAHQR